MINKYVKSRIFQLNLGLMLCYLLPICFKVNSNFNVGLQASLTVNLNKDRHNPGI
jgi:hypothetical protein